MTAVNGHFGPLQNCLWITLIPSAFPAGQNSPDNVDTILYNRVGNVDTSIYQETYCPGNVDTSLYRDDNVYVLHKVRIGTIPELSCAK